MGFAAFRRRLAGRLGLAGWLGPWRRSRPSPPQACVAFGLRRVTVFRADSPPCGSRSRGAPCLRSARAGPARTLPRSGARPRSPRPRTCRPDRALRASPCAAIAGGAQLHELRCTIASAAAVRPAMAKSRTADASTSFSAFFACLRTFFGTFTPADPLRHLSSPWPCPAFPPHSLFDDDQRAHAEHALDEIRAARRIAATRRNQGDRPPLAGREPEARR